MATYSNKTTPASRARLRAARERVGDKPNTLPLEAFRLAPLVHVHLLDFSEAWDGLFLTATSAGVPHLVAQEALGRAFSLARLYPFATPETPEAA